MGAMAFAVVGEKGSGIVPPMERTEAEFAQLFAKSGWRLSRVVPTKSPKSIIEGVPV